ncbi:MAG: transcription-repair coupling factor [Anaerolineae bacterium]|nr:transcription-repair coupling factor [Anaerolineae bacterium]
MPTSLRGLLTWIQEHPAYRDVLGWLTPEPGQEGSTERSAPADVSPGATPQLRTRQAQSAGAAPTIKGIPAVGLLPHARPAVIAALLSETPTPVVVIVPTIEESRRLTVALQTWMADPARLMQFPEPPGLLYERVPWPPEVIDDRLNVISRLVTAQADDTERAKPVIVTSARALMRRTLPYRQFRKAIRHIRAGAREPLTELTRHATGIGYEPVSVVQTPGELSRRGGLLDIYPPQAERPYRLEFFGDEIDTIRTFDPETQRSVGRVEEFWLPPVREGLPRDSERALEAVQRLLATEAPKELRSVLEADAEALSAQAPFPNLEFYLPYLYQEVGTLLHYLPREALVVLVDSDQLAVRWEELEREAIEQRASARTEQILLEDAPVPYVTWRQIKEVLGRIRALAVSNSEEGPLVEAFRPEPHFAGRLPEALGRIRQWVNLGDQVVIVSRQAARMAELWQTFTPPPVHQGLETPPTSLLTFVQGVISGGWQWHGEEGIRHLLTDEELFGWQLPEPRRQSRRRTVAPEQGFADLQPGDPVVHEDYGIGIFRGLVARSVDQIEREYLLLEFAGPNSGPATDEEGQPVELRRDKLFVPIHQADRLSRYIGADGFGPHLSRLGGGAWEQIKARVAKAADDLARELLDLYASRQIVTGHAFEADTQWQQELEAAFPYAETQDQVEAIQAVKADMERPRPMDRLICGDAGYGKTEVALRAAFKAVMDNKQVAMLVPTTVLAQQHFHTFQERLSSFPVEVELLSRFRTEREQHEVLVGLREGTTDIVIGTHRLLQRDVQFRDLGLVVIDEEQRFGVAHKERLKQMRTEVDVLTLTATPIPRTLYMALAGVRDINIIETPPQERLPIATYVGPYDRDVARRAMLRELKRGGQVFYVHNRVESIPTVAARLQSLIPEANLGIAHGQMRERELSEVMEAFTAGEIDVLLATTIIESGLDFPNANTLIVERADWFGLAQLYQLRGRIGRGTRRGYAYFFHRRRMTGEARERLLALRESMTQGGGFTVALRDLEIRGAGDLLGRDQHGHVAAVGFTLYTRLLNRAVNRLRAQQAGEPLPPEPLGSITIELPLAVGLPTTYVPDDALRLQLYRRLAEMTTEEDVAQLRAELQDRFGPLPIMAQNMIYQLRLKLLAREARIPAIAVESGQIVLKPPWLKDMDPGEIARLRRELQEQARVGRREIWLPLSWDESRWQGNLEHVLTQLASWWEEETPALVDASVETPMD